MHPYRNAARAERETRIRRMGGGPVEADEVQDKKIVKKAFGQHDTQLHKGKKTRLNLATGGAASPMEGDESKKRLDRKPRGASNAPVVNIVIADKGGEQPPMAPPPPPMMKPPMPPMGGPGGAPPPGPGPGPGAPPPMGAMAPALATNPALKQALAARAAPPGASPMRNGGGVEGQDAGAGSGEGRLQKARLVHRQ